MPTLRQAAQRYIEWRLPELEGDPELVWRASTLVVTISMVALVLPPFIVLNLWLGQVPLALFNVALLVLTAAQLMLIKTTGNLTFVAHALGLTGTAAVIGSAAVADGTSSVSLAWLALLVMLLVLGGGTRVGAIWAGVGLLCIGALLLLQDQVLAVRIMSHDERTVGGAMNAGMCILFALAMGELWDSRRRRALEEARAAAESLQDAERKALLTERLASVGTLATGVAHELNTPMTWVGLNLERLAAGVSDPEEVKRLAAECLEGNTRMRDIVLQLKTFSRSDEAGTAVVPVHRVVSATLRMFDNVLRHGADVELEVDETACVNINEGRLAQVLVNLVSNAIDALPEQGRQRIALRVAIVGEDVHIEVTDSGAGMSPEVLSRALDPFFTTKQVGKGTGLGLSICHSLIEEVGGTLQITSEPGVGTTVALSLPAASRPTNEPPQERLVTAPSIEGYRILAIDDDAVLGRVLRRSLAGHAVEVQTAAREALARLEQTQRFDVIICDLMMPEMPGWELYRELESRYPDLAERTFFISGGAFTEGARAFVAEHSARLLPKPFSTGQLREMVERCASGELQQETTKSRHRQPVA